MKHWEHLNYSSPCLSLFIRKHKNSKSICQFAGLIYKNDKTLVLVDLSNKCLPSMECQAWIIKAQIKSYMEFEGTWKTTSSCPDRLQMKLRSSGEIACLWPFHGLIFLVHCSFHYNMLKVLLDPLKTSLFPRTGTWYLYSSGVPKARKLIKIN